MYRYTDVFDKVLVPVFLLQLFIKLRCKYSQKLGVTRDERAIGVGSTKNDSVARSSADDRAAEVTLDSLHVGTRLYELHANRRNTRPCADASGSAFAGLTGTVTAMPPKSSVGLRARPFPIGQNNRPGAFDHPPHDLSLTKPAPVKRFV